MMDQLADKAEIEHLLDEDEESYRQSVAKSNCRHLSEFLLYGLFALSICFNILQAIIYGDISVKLDNRVSQQLSNFGKY